MRSDKERSLTRDFGQQYRELQDPAMGVIERSVCGCDYGGTSWTTRREADQIQHLLGLEPGVHLLEVGAGSGWPGLYLCKQADCNLALVDLPLDGLLIAADRATRDHLGARCCFAVADGSVLPFAERSFDAVSHSDVLCCLNEKSAVLRECRRVITRHGRMAFTVISVATGLSTTQFDTALEYGPPFIYTSTEYQTMLASAGWEIDSRIDLTAQFASSAHRYLDHMKRYRSDLERVRGRTAYSEQLNRMQSKIEAIDDGLIRRNLYVTSPSKSGC